MNDLVMVKGLSELNKFLQQLPVNVEQNVLSGALREGSKVIAAEAKRLLISNGSVVTGKLRDSIRVRTSRRRGKVRATISAAGEMNEAIWVEYGTKPHLISVRDESRPRRLTRRGLRRVSIRTLNRMINRGSLRIGDRFIGPSVAHPGSRAKPFMRPALDTKAREAVIAAANYMKKRLATKHGLTRAADVEID